MKTKEEARAEVRKLSHPAANIFPMMSDAELDVLAKDIKENGQNESIVFLDCKIIDGRNRWVACEMIGKEDVGESELDPKAVQDPVAYVISQNLHRRHLTETQRAMVAARVMDTYRGAAKERQREAGKNHGRGQTEKVRANLPESNGRAREQAAKTLSISPRSVEHGATVLKDGSAELVALVDSGKVAVSKAAKVAKSTSKKDQAAAATKPREPRKSKPKPEPVKHTNDEAEVVASITFDDSYIDGFDSIPAYERIDTVKKIIGKLTQAERELIVGWIGTT